MRPIARSAAVVRSIDVVPGVAVTSARAAGRRPRGAAVDASRDGTSRRRAPPETVRIGSGGSSARAASLYRSWRNSFWASQKEFLQLRYSEAAREEEPL